jgi:hypothetical protein
MPGSILIGSVHRTEMPTADRARSFAGLPSSLKSYDVARRWDRELLEENHGVRGKPHDNGGFAALAQLESA